MGTRWYLPAISTRFEVMTILTPSALLNTNLNGGSWTSKRIGGILPHIDEATYWGRILYIGDRLTNKPMDWPALFHLC